MILFSMRGSVVLGYTEMLNAENPRTSTFLRCYKGNKTPQSVAPGCPENSNRRFLLSFLSCHRREPPMYRSGRVPWSCDRS